GAHHAQELVRVDLEADLTQHLLTVEGVADAIDNDLGLHQLMEAGPSSERSVCPVDRLPPAGQRRGGVGPASRALEPARLGIRGAGPLGCLSRWGGSWACLPAAGSPAPRSARWRWRQSPESWWRVPGTFRA